MVTVLGAGAIGAGAAVWHRTRPLDTPEIEQFKIDVVLLARQGHFSEAASRFKGTPVGTSEVGKSIVSEEIYKAIVEAHTGAVGTAGGTRR